MRTISLLGWAAVLVLAGCTTTTTDSNLSHPPVSGDGDGNTDTDPGTNVGTENSNGEHGTNTPAGDTSTPTTGTTLTTETWSGTKSITSNVTIPAGQTITIAPGTVVTVSGTNSDGTTPAITVLGTLKVAATSTTLAKITATAWQGLVIGPGGTLDATGLELDGAAAAIWTQKGNTAATFKQGVITAQTPFKMEAGSTLTVDHTSVTATEGSAIAGTFTATYMNYNKTTAGGLTLADAAGTMTITDSTLTGQGGGDYVIANSGVAVNVSYTTITGSHCGFHFSPVTKFTIDHVSVQGNSYGAMLYGSTTGGTITSSNFRDNSTVDIDFTKDTNGPVTIDSSFMTPPTNITPTNPATAAIADAQPRPDAH